MEFADTVPSERGWQEIRVGIALTALATVAVALRFTARLKRKLRLAIDDWFALAGLVMIIAMFIQMVLWATIGGNGKHMQILSLPQIAIFLKIFLANEFTYSLTSPIIKLSIILFYRRLFATRPFQIAAAVLMGAAVAWGVATFLAAALQCRPLSGFWDHSIDGHCFNALQYILGVQGVNIALDFAILCLPMPMVWGLQRPWQDKAALSVVFALGGFVVGASIYRIVTLLYIDPTDLTYTTYLGVIWTFVEPCIGLVCACLPIIRGLFPAYTSKRGSSAKRSNLSGLPTRRTPLPGSRSHGDAEYVKMNDLRSYKLQNDTSRLLKPGKTEEKVAYDKIRVRTTIEVV